MLTEAERKLLQTAWSAGPSVLLNAGYTAEQIRLFFERDDVQSDLVAMDREFKHAADFDARTRYTTRKQLSQLSPGAVGLLAKAMRGPLYVVDEQGNVMRDARGFPIIREAELTPAQLRAAQIVVDAVGGSDQKASDYRGDLQINVLLSTGQRVVTLDHGDKDMTPEQKAISRERIRNAIDRLLPRMPAAQANVQKALGGPSVLDVQATAKKVVAKKVVAPVAKKPVKGVARGGQEAQ